MKRWLILLAVLFLPSMANAACVVGATGVVGSGTCALTGSKLIATLTASSSASLQFYGANWSSSYPTLRLRCRSILLSANSVLAFHIGEGGGGGQPTWQTSNSYFSTGWYVNSSGAFVPWQLATATDLLDNSAALTTIPTSWDIEIDNVSSTSAVKPVYYSAAAGVSLSGSGYVGPESGMAYWSGDNAAITGLRIIPQSGTIASGTCSLYGELQ